MRTPRPVPAVALAVSVTVSGVLPVFLVGSLATQYSADLGASPALVGGVIAVYWAASALSSAPAGQVAERWGARVGIALSALLATIATTGVALFAPSIWALGGWLIIAGLSNALAHPPSNALIAASVPTRTGTALGIKQAAIPLATLAAGFAVPVLGASWGWQSAFAAAGLLALVVAVVTPAAVPRLARKVRPPEGDRVFPRPLARYLRALALSGFFGVAQANMIGGFAVTTAVDRGFSPGTAGIVVGLVSLVGIAARIVVGALADGLSRASMVTVAAMLGIGSLGLVGLGLASGGWFVVGLVLAFGFGWSWNGLVHYIVASRAGARTAAATGRVQGGAYAGGAVGPLAFGLVAQTAGTSAAWLAGAAIAVTSAAVALVAWRMEARL